MSWLTGNSGQLGIVAAKAALMYVTALLALRVGERRTLAQWTLIDFATAVAMGAIIGRSALAGNQSYVTGAVALVTLVVIHRAASVLRFNSVLGKLADHRVRVLVSHGEIRRKELRFCGLTDNDLLAQLRQRDVLSLDEVRYVLYEAKGDLTIVRQSAVLGPQDPPLVEAGLEGSAGYR